MQIRRSDLDQLHAEFARQKAGQRHFELRVGKKEHALAGQHRGVPADGLARARDAPAA